MMPARKYQAGSDYRYGFNGKENDNDVKSEGNQQDYGMRIYDSRLVRFLSVDPVTENYPWNSTYSFAENDVIRSIDLDGKEKYIVFRELNNSGELISISIQTFTDKNGNPKDNEMYKYNSYLEKADVYVINENINTGTQIGKIKYVKKLTADQDKVYKQFGVRLDVAKKLQKTGDVGDRFEFETTNNGAIKGKDFTDGFEVKADLDVNVKFAIPFVGGTNTPTNPATATSQLARIARTLNLFPASTATITGNTGNDPGSTTPVGNTPAILAIGNIALNGGVTNLGGLMIARGNAIKGILNLTYGINNNRLNTTTGTNNATPAGRTVDIHVKSLNL